MKRNQVIFAAWLGTVGGLVVLYPLLNAQAGTQFLVAAQARVARTNLTATPGLFDPNGTTIVIATQNMLATPAAESTLVFIGDANAYTTKQCRITQATNGKVRYYINAGGTGEGTNALDPNLVNLLTFHFAKTGDGNMIGKLWQNGDAVVSKTFTAEPNCVTWGVLSFGTVAGLTTLPFTGELEQIALYYQTDPNTAAALHTAVWNGGSVLSTGAAAITATYPPAHRWRLTGGTPGATVVSTDVYIDDVGTAANGDFDCNVIATDANYPKYTANYTITPTTLTVADGNNVTFSGPCGGVWTGGRTYAITGTSTSWTVTALDPNHTWWAPDPNAGVVNGDVGIALTADANALAPGVYTSTIVFHNADVGGLPAVDITRTITLTVTAPDATTLVDPNAAAGYTWQVIYATSGDGNTFTPSVVNNAACAVVMRVLLADSNWSLSFDPNNCTAVEGGCDCNVPAGDTLSVPLSLEPNAIGAMPLGSWASSLVISADSEPNNWVTIPLLINVVAGTIDDPNAVEFAWTESHEPNDVDDATYERVFTNAGDTRTFVVGFADPNLLSLVTLSALCSYDPAVGLECPVDAGANLTVTIGANAANAVMLAAGVHSYSLLIYPEGDANAPVTVPVTMTVAAGAGGQTRYVSADGADYIDGGELNNCLSPDAKCGSVDHTYDVMQDGDTAIVSGLLWVDGDSVLHADENKAVTFTGDGATWRNSTTSEPVVLIQTATSGGLTLGGSLTLDGIQNGLANGSCVRQTASGVDLTMRGVTLLPSASADYAVYVTAGDVVTLGSGLRWRVADTDTQLLHVSGATTVVETLSAGGQKIITFPQ